MPEQDVATQARLVPIVVLKLPFESECKVVPPIAIVIKANADKLRFINQTGDDIRVILPAGVTGTAENIEIGDRDHEDVSVSGGTPGVYAYEVKCERTESFARGNSDPVIVVG